MNDGTPSERELDGYRTGADRFIAELDEEYYQHYAGLKDRLELEEIYDRHSMLTELENVQAVGEAVNGDRRIRELWHFGCEGYLGNLTREHAEKVAAIEAELEVTVDGKQIPFRMLRPEMANEPDRDRREKLDRAMWEATEEHLNPIYLDAVEIERRELPALGASSYVHLYEQFGFRLKELATQCEAFLADTERLYEDVLGRAARKQLGLSLDDLARWDLQRMIRSPQWDEGFPADKLVPALKATLNDLGIDLDSQENIHLDIEQRPQKTPRAFCSPIEIPDKVMLVIQPQGGPDDWRALFHEAGHTEHYAHTSADLTVEARRLGDNAVTEGWAMLLELLVNEPTWLERRLDFARPEDFAAEASAGQLYFVRRYAAKFLYELELHGETELESMRARYAERMYDALKIEVSDADFLADVDAGFYSSSYLRAWAFESLLRSFLREEFGRAWFTRREAGSLLRELWAEGQKPTADELLAEVAGAELELRAVAERIGETVA